MTSLPPDASAWLAGYRDGLMTTTTCHCAGCIGMGPCDDGTECVHGCGGRASTPWGTCQSCEDGLTGCDEDGDDW